MASLSATTAAASWTMLRPPWMRSLLFWQQSGARSLCGWCASQALHCYQMPSETALGRECMQAKNPANPCREPLPLHPGAPAASGSIAS